MASYKLFLLLILYSLLAFRYPDSKRKRYKKHGLTRIDGQGSHIQNHRAWIQLFEYKILTLT